MDLKPIAHDAVPRALEKAERYRLLNEPFLAESICLDVLALEPENQPALTTYVLALTDQFASVSAGIGERARAAVARLSSEYDRHYYSGIICERRGAVILGRTGVGTRDAAWGLVTEAMAWYEKALAVRPAHNDDAILRWNTCVRLIQAHRLSAPIAKNEQPPHD